MPPAPAQAWTTRSLPSVSHSPPSGWHDEQRRGSPSVSPPMLAQTAMQVPGKRAQGALIGQQRPGRTPGGVVGAAEQQRRQTERRVDVQLAPQRGDRRLALIAGELDEA